MMRFQVFLSLWSVTSCLCMDKIPEVAKTKVSTPKRYSLYKTRPHPHKTAHSNTHVYITVWEDVHKTVQMFTQRKKAELLFSL